MSNGKKEPKNNVLDRLRSFFAPQDLQKKKDGLPPKAHFSIWYFLIAFLLIIYLQEYFLSRKVETIPYSQFKQQLAAGYVTKLTIGPENITGTLKGKDKEPDQQFMTIRVADPNLVKELDEHKVAYSGYIESKFLGTLLSWILPIAIMLLIWQYAMKKMGPGMGVMSFAKSKAKLFAQNETMVTFADVAGIDEARARAAGGCGVFEVSGEIPETGRADSQRCPSRWGAGHGQNSSGQGSRRRGKGSFLQHQRV